MFAIITRDVWRPNLDEMHKGRIFCYYIFDFSAFLRIFAGEKPVVQ